MGLVWIPASISSVGKWCFCAFLPSAVAAEEFGWDPRWIRRLKWACLQKECVSVHWLLHRSLTCVTEELWRLLSAKSCLLLGGCCFWKAETIPWRTWKYRSWLMYWKIAACYCQQQMKHDFGTEAVGGFLAQPTAHVPSGSMVYCSKFMACWSSNWVV